MFNLLTQEMPQTVDVCGLTFDIDYRFDTILRIIDCMDKKLFDEDYTKLLCIKMFFYQLDEEKYISLKIDGLLTFCDLSFKNNCFIIDDKTIHIDLFYTELIKFILMYDTDIKTLDKKDKKLLCYDKDSNDIFTHFYKCYRIDLEKEKIHWFKFKTLLNDIGKDESNLQFKIRIRDCSVSSIAKEKRAEFLKLQNKFKL